MKTVDGSFTQTALSLAVRGALLAMCVLPLAGRADDMSDEVKALVLPTSHIDVGVMGTTSDSTKFGEYNGLQDSGPHAVGNFDVQGGNAYGMAPGTIRWEAHGIDLGTTSREVNGSVTDQGRWNLGVGFDQLRHYTTENYQTPFQGSQGDNRFTLPPSFGVINTQQVNPAGTGTQSLTLPQLQSFRTEDVYTERTNTSFKAGYNFDRQWSVDLNYNHLDQSGAKLIGAATDNINPGPGGYRYRAEGILILMNPTEYQTDTLGFGVNWRGQQAHLGVHYFGSFFHDDYSGLTFSNPLVRNGGAAATTGDNPGSAFPLNTMSTPPSNQFHQFTLDGGYNFSSATKVAAKFSMGRNTQDESYTGTYTTTPNTVTSLPVNSLDGVVVTTHGDLRLTHQVDRDLGLTARFRYDKRDNQTPSNTYTFLDLGGSAQTVVNIPMSNERYHFDLGGDYRIGSKQRVHLGYEYEHVSRWCDNALANNAQGVGPSGYTAAQYYTAASCAQVPKSDEHKGSIEYKVMPVDSLHLHAGFTYSDRSSEVNSAFYNPMQANSEGYENFGYLAFFQASRKEKLFKAGVSWDATQQFNVGLNGRYARDNYDSVLGVQNGDAGSLNLDLTYAFSEKSTVAAYASWQTRSRDLLTAQNRDALAPLATLWTNNLTDHDLTIGLSGKQKGLLGSKLDLSEDATYSLGKTRYSTTLLGAATAVGADGETPNIKSQMLQLSLTGNYHVDKHSSVIMGYRFQVLSTNDYYYNGYQYGYTPSTMLSTNQQAPSYTDHTIFAAYRYSFQ